MFENGISTPIKQKRGVFVEIWNTIVFQIYPSAQMNNAIHYEKQN